MNFFENKVQNKEYYTFLKYLLKDKYTHKMITRTFLDKTTTIYRDSEDNYGLYPVCMLSYGKNVSRGLIHFDLGDIEAKIKDKTYGDASKLTHTLKFTNCGSIDKKRFGRMISGKNEITPIQRASSFDVIVFRIPREWDEGVGFDSSSDFWFFGKKSDSQNGCNWYQSANGNLWENTDMETDEGVYSNSFLSREYTKWGINPDSTDIIINRQHFDYGNEDFQIDVTKYVNGVLSGKYKNHGLGLAFSPALEDSESEFTQYVGFFTQNTNTIFVPCLETRDTSDEIADDRYKFFLNKKNKLYLMASIDGTLENLDKMPTCKINGTLYEVKQHSKGVYYIELKLSSKEHNPNEILYDTWSNLMFNGDEIDDVEMEFVTLKPNNYFSLGETPQVKTPLSVSLVGINDGEIVNRGDKRLIRAIFKVPYTHSDYELTDKAEYRIYAKDSNSEIDIIPWDRIERASDFNYFYVDTKSFVPAEYHIDIRMFYGNETRVYKDELKFKINNNKTYFRK